MGWGPTIGVILITTVLGGLFAAGAAVLLVDWLKISSFEGGAGLFAFVVMQMGMGAGFLTGLIVALVVRSDFWKAQGYAAGIIGALAILGVILPVVFNGVFGGEGPKLDGETLALQIELKSPPGWRPDRSRAGQGDNVRWLQPNAADDPEARRESGFVRMRLRQEDGRWIAFSGFDLEDTRSRRYARILLGTTLNVSIEVPPPRHPTAQYKQWSAWTGSGFYPQKDAPVPPGFTWRFRVQTASEDQREFPDLKARVEEFRRQRLAGVQKEDPLVKWLPLFEGPDGEQETPPNPEAAHSLLQERSAELAQLLRSPDPNIRRAAVFAAAHYYPKLPEAIIRPLAAAGEHTVDLIREATTPTPDEPDLDAEKRAYTYFIAWQIAEDRAGEQAGPVFQPVLEKIERAALQFQSGSNAGAQGSQIGVIAEFARKNLDTIAAAK